MPKLTTKSANPHSARSTSGIQLTSPSSRTCGEKLVLTAITNITICRQCGADLESFVHDIQEREGPLPDTLTHPWFYDAQVQADQSLRDEATYPKGSPWRYDDVTAENDG